MASMNLAGTFHKTIIWGGILFTVFLLTVSSSSTIAQSDCYPRGTVYIVGNMNIRESASTDSRVVATARAGDSFTISQSQRGASWCWLNIGAGWIAKTSRVGATESAITSRSQKKQAQQPVQQQSDIDNCCFVDRQCDTDEEWTRGYWAFKNKQCDMPTGSQTQSQSRATASEEVDNCCFIGWQCEADEEWRSGYWAFQNDQCDAPAQWREQWSQFQQQQRQQQPSSSDGRYPKRTYDPYTRTTTFVYEDGTEIIARPPTDSEFCDALERLDLPLPPRCEES
jgi:hypothetical protein